MRFGSERRIFNSSPIFEISLHAALLRISDVARASDLPSKYDKASSIASEFGDGRESVHTSRSHNKLRQSFDINKELFVNPSRYS